MRWFNHRAANEQRPCAHAHALARWDNVEDAGNMDRVSNWYCPECDRFLPARPAALAS